jgi:hypothetical protein
MVNIVLMAIRIIVVIIVTKEIEIMYKVKYNKIVKTLEIFEKGCLTTLAWTIL